MIMAVHRDQDATLWLGTLGGGLLRIDQQSGRVTPYRRRVEDPNSLVLNQVWALHQDRRGTLWVGTGDGLSAVDPRTGTVTSYPLPRSQAVDLAVIYAITEDTQGSLWITGARDLYRLDPVTGRLLTHIDIGERIAMRSNLTLQDVLFTPPGTLWLGVIEAGLFRYDLATQALTQYPFGVQDQTGLAGKTVWDLHADAAGALWLGTDAGLARLDPATSDLQDRLRGFAHFSIYSAASSLTVGASRLARLVLTNSAPGSLPSSSSISCALARRALAFVRLKRG